MIRYLPNLVTVFRLLLVAPFVWALLEQRHVAALWLFLLMGISDGLDGFLARTFGWRTVSGAYLDPVADKFMLISSYATMGWVGLLPLWLVVLVILRDLMIVAGAAVYQFVTHRLEMQPSLSSKINTGFQILLVLAMLIDRLTPLPEWTLVTLIALTALTTVVSGGGYIVTWVRRARIELGRGAR